MKLYPKGITYWATISIASIIIYYLLWWIVDKTVLTNYGFNLTSFSKDFGCCAILSGLTLMICHLVTAIPFFRSNDIIRIFMLTSVIFTLSVLLALCVEILWNYHEPVRTSIRILDVYFFSVISAFVSTIFITKYYCTIVSRNNRANNALQMQLLKRQLDPHFMFNSLNTLAELIHENPTAAEEFTIRLSNVYRYILLKFNEDIISIHDAIYIAREYCNLLDTRYPNDFIINIDPRIDQSKDKLLTLSLQQLVENAIKHNSHSADNPLEITMTIDDKYVTVRNRLAPVIDRSIQSNGIGLANLKDRYSYFTKLPLIINKTNDYFEVKLPIIKDHENIDN